MATNPCGSGSSGVPKPGVQGAVSLLGVAIGDILLKGRAAWAYDIAVAMGYINFDTASFCVGGRPDLPDTSAARVAGYFNPLNPLGAAQLREDMTQLVGHFLWDDICQCSDGSTPPVAAPAPPPSGWVVDPPSLANPTGSPCATTPILFETKTFDASGDVQWDWTPNTALHTGIQWVSFAYSGDSPGATSSFPITHTMEFLPTGSTNVLQRYTWVQTGAISAQARQTISFAVDPGAQQIRLRSHTDTGAGNSVGLDLPLLQYCSATPRSLDDPCCPPDPAITQMLAQIMRMLQELLARPGARTPPVDWIDGVRHNSLSGSGRVQLAAGVTGVRVEVTTMPPNVAESAGDPNFFWDMGFITPLAIDIPLRGQRIVFNPENFALPIQADGCAWSLPAGAIINLVELLPANP